MSFGIGLGAFVDGLGRGMEVRDRIDARNKQKKIDAGIASIEKDTEAKFADPLSDDAYDYMMKRQELLYRQNGDIKTAMAFRQFADQDSTRRGTKLFASSLFKAQTGDAAGALTDAIKAGQINGYLDHGYEVLGRDEIKDSSGATVGFRLNVKGPDGKTVQQDVAIGDIPRLVSTFANPQAAWESQVAAKDAKKKRDEGLQDYKAKKKIDREYDKPAKNTDAADYQKVSEQLSKSDLDWGDRSPEEQDKLIRQNLEAANRYAAERNADGGPAGGAAAPAPAPQKIIMDQATGQPIDPAALGLGGAPNSAQPISTAPGITGVAPSPSVAPSSQATGQAPKGPSKDQMIAEAADYIVKGGNPQYIAQQLMNAGIAEQEWPVQVRSAIAKQPPRAPIGLGQ